MPLKSANQPSTYYKNSYCGFMQVNVTQQKQKTKKQKTKQNKKRLIIGYFY